MLCCKPKTKNIMKELIEIQKRLNAPKNQFNSFGKYHYRNTESILEAVKPLLKEFGLAIVIEDNIEEKGSRIYVCATVKLINTDEPTETIITKAYAREAEQKKGMDSSQVTGATSSYARKYALSGMFAIDDNKDPDTDEYTHTNNRSETQENSNGKTRAMKELVDFTKAKKIDPVAVTQTIQEQFKKSNSKELDEDQLKALLNTLRGKYSSK